VRSAFELNHVIRPAVQEEQRDAARLRVGAAGFEPDDLRVPAAALQDADGR
jgi:hypothetical protein